MSRMISTTSAMNLGLWFGRNSLFGGDMIPGDVAFQENVTKEAIDQIKRLRDHPSIVLWCGNNEVETGWWHWGDRQEFKASISPDTRDKVWQDYVIMGLRFSRGLPMIAMIKGTQRDSTTFGCGIICSRLSQ